MQTVTKNSVSVGVRRSHPKEKLTWNSLRVLYHASSARVDFCHLLVICNVFFPPHKDHIISLNSHVERIRSTHRSTSGGWRTRRRFRSTSLWAGRGTHPNAAALTAGAGTAERREKQGMLLVFVFLCKNTYIINVKILNIQQKWWLTRCIGFCMSHIRIDSIRVWSRYQHQ